jgi:(p)ppGpp synthase/HD superfamily hydrolase
VDVQEELALPDELAELGDEVREAFEVAAAAHAHQRRKGDGSPYITHPLTVAGIVRAAGMDSAAVAAALLHDVVEDTPITLDALRSRFAPRVIELVEAMTEHKDTVGYERRKDEHREQIERAGADAARIYAADKLANLRDMRRIFAEVGESAAGRFRAPLGLRIELWHRDVEMVERLAGANGHVSELRSELERFETELENLEAERRSQSS